MRFFNIDLHASVIEDIRDLFSGMGHEVVNWSLSSHNWVFKKPTKRMDILNPQVWQHLNEDMCSRFYRRYRDELSDYDGFIVTHTPSFALLYREFDKPVIAVASTRYEAPFTGDGRRWDWLNGYLRGIHGNGRLIATANNKYDKNYCERFTGFGWEQVP